MVWSLALRPDDAKRGPVAHATEFGVVSLAKRSHIASIQQGRECLNLYLLGLERERQVW